MLSAVPDRAAFATQLAAVRAWAKASGLYGTQRGVCGLCWAILTAYVSRHLPHDAPAAADGGGEGWLSGPDRPAAERRLQRFLAEFFVRTPLPPLPTPSPITSRLIVTILRGVQHTGYLAGLGVASACGTHTEDQARTPSHRHRSCAPLTGCCWGCEGGELSFAWRW